MLRSIAPALLIFLAACASDADRVVPPGRTSTEALTMEEERERAFVAALDTLEALVVTLEAIQDPMSAWNRAEEASRLLNALERDRANYALSSEEEAARLYPDHVDRLKRLEARRDAELNRIMQDPVSAQVLIEEMNKAEAGN